MRWLRIITAARLLFFFSILSPAWAQRAGAQQATPVVIHPMKQWQWPNAIAQFQGVAPDITLIPRGEGSRHGQLWIRTVLPGPISGPELGLYIAGQVDGPQPDFPLTRDLIPSKDHIEIWLAGSRDVDLPEIGWRNQFEDIKLPKGAESCKDWAEGEHFAQGAAVDLAKECQEWAESQVRYREYFKRLFVRQWLLGPREQIEVYATPAFQHIVDWYGSDEFDQFMKPKGKPELFSFFHESSGYSFQVFIPFQAFPPLPQLDLNELYLLVDIFNAAPAGKKMGIYSTSSPARAWGNPTTFNVLRLDPPFSLPLTLCKLPLGEPQKVRNAHLTWALPRVKKFGGGINVLSDTFVVENMGSCGAWDPGGVSPWVRMTHHFWMGTRREIGVWACGPDLTIAKVVSETFPFGKSETFPYVVGEEGLDYKRMPNGHLLIKFGPRSQEGTGCGQGGGAPITELQIFDLTQDMALHEALTLGDTIDGVRLASQDFTITPDWSQITEYDDIKTGAASDSWSSTTWCLKLKAPNHPGGDVYEKCGEKEDVEPPNPPVLKELREGVN